MNRILIYVLSFVWILFGQAVSAQTYSHILQMAQKEQEARAMQFSPNQTTGFNASNLDVIHYRGYWKINPANDSIYGKVAITFKALQNLDSLTLDFASNLIVDRVKFRSGVAQASFPSTYTLKVKLGQTMAINQTDSVVIWYHGRPAASDMGSFTRTTHSTGPIVYTLSEPYGAKDWWPCKMGLVDKADSIDVTIYTPAPFVAVSNGLLVNQTESNGWKTYHWKHKYPIATYLIAIAVSNYSHFRLKAVLQGDTLPIDNYCYPQSLATWQTGMQAIVQIIQDYDTLVLPYPFKKEKYGHAQFGFGGGMEHQTISFMEGPDFYLQAHELAHHWFGNLVTCGSWRDIWLNEGFATYMGGNAVDRAGIRSWADQAKDLVLGVTSVPTGSVYCSDTTNVGRIFDGRLSYGKGAALLRMLRWQVGDSAFWAGIRMYLSNPALRHRFAKTSDLKSAMEAASNQTLTEFFADWCYGEGHPNLAVEYSCCSPNGQLVINQTPSHGSVSFFEIQKVPVVLVGFNGERFAFTFSLTQNGQVVELPQVGFALDTILLDPEYQILARWTYTENLVSSTKTTLTEEKTIYPNPTSEFLKLKEITFDSYQIVDANGRGVQSGYVDGCDIEIRDLKPGLYCLRIYSANGIEAFRFRKE